MKLLSTNTCRIPKDLSSVTDTGPEEMATAGGMTPAQVQRIWQATESLYKTGNHPMISICVRRKGHIVLNRAIGHAAGNSPDDRKDTPKRPALTTTPVCLFSASKVVTAMLVHMLDERGELNLLDPVSHYLPEFAANGKRKATIFHLLSHRGGIPKIDGDVSPELLFDQPAILKRLMQASPTSPSGHRLAYHALSAGYILGAIIEKVTGQDLRTFLHEHIEIPMEMRHFNFGLRPEFRNEVSISAATGVHPALGTDHYLNHVLGGGLQLAVDVTNDPRFYETISPAANLYTSAEEAGRFFEMLLNGGQYNGKQIFSPETVFRATLETTRPSIDHTLMVPMRYALGPMLGANPVGLYGPMTGAAFGHIGFTNIFCWADPARDISASILTTGKAVVGTHIPALANLLAKMSSQCPTLPHAERRSVFGRSQAEAVPI